MPTPSRRQDEGWYSFDQGPVHFVLMDTEMTAFAGSEQHAFFEKDLAKSLGPTLYVIKNADLDHNNYLLHFSHVCNVGKS